MITHQSAGLSTCEARKGSQVQDHLHLNMLELMLVFICKIGVKHEGGKVEMSPWNAAHSTLPVCIFI